MTATGSSAICPACSADTGAARFCGNCGSPVAPQVAGARGLLRDEAVEVVGLDRRLLRTLVDLLVHPVRITAAYMRGERGRYLSPLRLLLSLASIYTVALFLLMPLGDELTASLADHGRDNRAIALFQTKLAERGVTVTQASERYESRMTAVTPLTSAISVLPLMVLLRLMHRRRSWYEHLAFLLGATNIFYLYGILLLPLLALGKNTFLTVLMAAMYVLFGVLYFKIYPGRSTARTTAAFSLVALVSILTGFAIFTIAGVLVTFSLLFF